MISYADAGGRILTSHYGYDWFVNSGEFNNTATWDLQFTSDIATVTADVETAAPFGPTLSEWLADIMALSSELPPQIIFTSADHDVDAVTDQLIRWLSATDTQHPTPSAMVPQFNFVTPVGAMRQCGQVIYDGFHANERPHAPRFERHSYPKRVPTTGSSPQEQEFEHSLFELDSCVQ